MVNKKILLFAINIKKLILIAICKRVIKNAYCTCIVLTITSTPYKMFIKKSTIYAQNNISTFEIIKSFKF